MKRLYKFILPVFCSSLALSSVGQTAIKAKPTSATEYTRFVDPYIGTGFHGHVFLGANVPFGALQLGPVNMSEGWDWCSGYHISDSTIIGFSHTHLSGTGIGDLGDILVMPVVGNVKPRKGKLGDETSGYYSLFSHQEEKVRPGYYSVWLKRYGIQAELTTTERVGLHQYTFPQSNNAAIIFDLKEGIGWDLSTKTFIRQVNDTTISGYRFSKGWAAQQQIFFTAVFSKPIKNFSLYEDSVQQTGKEATGKRVKAVMNFETSKGEKILVKVGISPVSEENAAANIKAELPHWNFTKVVADANASWNRELSKIQVKTKDAARLKTFYTALYHTMIAPSLFNDHNGDYFGTDKKLHQNSSFKNYTTFSLWDTYRAANPLYTLFQKERASDMINSMLAIYQQQGKLPVWHLMGNETNTMPGYSAVPIVADAVLKGIKGIDANLAYEAVKNTAMKEERGIKWVKELGFIPADSSVESVSMGMEYAIDDWAIAQLAKKLGKKEDYEYFSKRGRYYQNYFDKETGFMRGRLSQNAWRAPFNPLESVHMKGDFTEGNGWQYTWLVPQDVEGLIKLLGGEQAFLRKLDSLFIVQGDMGKEASNDITGLIGQYAHGNEPSHHVTYMYAYAGQPWKTAEKVRFILDSLYSDKPDGLSGNEDVGQMSAWYVFSSLGFYPANPANGLYVFGSPVVDEAVISVGDGKKFLLQVKNNSKENKYIQRIILNGKPYTKSFIAHAEIMRGGSMQIEMGNKPSATWGVAPADRPCSECLIK